MKSAAAYLRNGEIFLHPDSRSVKGFWIAWEPVLVTSENDEALGGKVLWALSKSTIGVPHPESWDDPDSLVKAAGVRSYEAFAEFAKCVEIMLDDKGVIFTPSKNGGPGKRFLDLKTKIRCQPVEAEVAAALKAAFDACE